MCKRALLDDWKYSAALLDFSGAFDTIVREKALARFSDSGAATDVVATLISDTMMRVKLSSHLGKAFATNIGVVQGIRSLPSCTICMLSETCATLILCYRTYLYQQQSPNMQTTQQSMTRRGDKSRIWWRNQVKNSKEVT